MAAETELAAISRKKSGTGAVRRLRRDGIMPSIVYNSKGESHPIQLNQHDFEVLLHHHKSESLILDMRIDEGDPQKVLLKEVQHDPLTGTVLHADFVEISMTEKITIQVPLVLVGEPVGVTQEGGVLEQLLRELEVECLPSDLVESIEVDVSGLSIGDGISAGDLQVDPKLTILTDAKIGLACVVAPRKEEEEVPAEAEEGAEPELVGEKKEEGEEKAGEEEKPEKDSEKDT